MSSKHTPPNLPMSNDESHELQGQQEIESISSDAEDWGSQFVKHLELEYTNAASELPTGATGPHFRQAMMTAVVKVLHESGAKSEEITRLLKESVSRRSPIDSSVEWTSERNARRLELIDKWIQQTLSPGEAVELERLTERMRVHCDTEEMVPLEGARRLHRHLLGIDDSERTPS